MNNVLSTTTRRISFCVISLAQIAFTYLWLFQSQEWAGNLMKFLLGWALFTSIALLTKEGRKIAKAHGRSMPAWLSNTPDLIVLLMLVSQGHFIMGAIIVFSILSEEVALSQ